MKRRAFLGLGATSVGVGALYGTGAFSSVSAGRGVSVSAADDGSALLELDIAESVASNNDGEWLFSVKNNFEANLDLDVELIEDAADDNTITLVEDSAVIGSGDEVEFLVDLEEANPDTDEIDFAISAGTSNASVTLERGEVTITNPGGGGGDDGPAAFSASDVRDDDGQFAQTFSYNVDALENKDDATIDLEEAQEDSGADYSNANAEITSGQNVRDFEFDRSIPEIIYTAGGGTDGTLQIEVTDIELTSDIGGTAYYTDDQGREDQDNFSTSNP